MRWSSVLVALLVAAAPAVAQEPLLSDAGGDEEAQVIGERRDPPADRYAHVDLLSFDLSEDADAFSFVLEVAGLEEDAAATFDGNSRYVITFTYAGIDYGIEVHRYIDVDGTRYHYASVVEYTEDDDYRYGSWRADVELTVDDQAGTFSGTFPREALTDSKGAVPSKGDSLQDLSATATSYGVYITGGVLAGLNYFVEDRMPDEGAAAYEIQLGIAQSGDAALMSQDPFRVSNGGATSLVYEVTATNAGERQAFRLEAHDVPMGWTVSFPFERLVLGEGESTTFPVLVVTESGHRHGGRDSFRVTMTGERDESDVGRIDIGIKYTDVPQPAGHHPKLWIHTMDPWGRANEPWSLAPEIFGGTHPYMNALEEDPADAGVPAPSWYGSIPGTTEQHEWYVPLVPELAMGLDFDLRKDGTIHIPIQYEYAAQDVKMRAMLYHDGRQTTLLAQTEWSDRASWQQGTHAFEVPLTILEEADFVAYEKGADVWLEVRVEGVFLGPGPFGPGASPRLAGGWLELPLNEYRDPLDTFYASVESLRFAAEYLERQVNPGKTLLFETHLRNAASKSIDVELNLTGVHSQWARILGDDAFKLGAGQERKVAVAVKVPADMPDGALADLLLQASSKEDSFVRAVLNMVALVDEEAQHGDDSDKVAGLDKELQDGKKSPGFEVAAVMAGLLALVLLRRRR